MVECVKEEGRIEIMLYTGTPGISLHLQIYLRDCFLWHGIGKGSISLFLGEIQVSEGKRRILQGPGNVAYPQTLGYKVGSSNYYLSSARSCSAAAKDSSI